jgi:hypothetical protein
MVLIFTQGGVEMRVNSIGLIAGIVTVGVSVLGCGGAGGACDGNYTTADLSGCFQRDSGDGAVLNYYCFDGVGGFRQDGWNAMTGCAELHTGQYQIDGCKLKVCTEEGCEQYAIAPDKAGTGLYLDSEHYSNSNGCN